jgi:replication factor A1
VTEEDIESHIEDIINALKSSDSDKEVPREEIEREFNKFMEYGVPMDQAKQTLVKKYGGVAVFTTQIPSERTLISDLKPNQGSVKLLGRVIAVNPKDITVKGEERTIFYGIIGDESGTIPFTAWKNLEIEKGDIIEISNAYTREWQGAVQLNFGDRVQIEKTDKEKLPKSAFEPREFKVKDLRSGLGTVDVSVKILDINERSLEVNGEAKKVFSGILADETGKAQFTSWHDFKLKEGDVIRITGGYVKSWKGIPQLTFNQNATVKKLDKKKMVTGELPASKMSIHVLIEKRGALDVEVEGTIIDVRPGSGFILRCPECNRVLLNDECGIHGQVKGVPDLRIKIVIDDGTGAISGVLNQQISEKLIGKTLDECRKMKEEDLIQEIKTKLFARGITLQGNALGDEFGTSIIPKKAEFFEVDIKAEAEKLSQELEGLL